MKLYAKRWLRTGIALLSCIVLTLSILPSYAENSEELESKTSELETE